MRNELGQGRGSLDELLEPASFTTLDRPASERFDAWRSHMSGMVEISRATEPVTDFPATFTRWDFGG